MFSHLCGEIAISAQSQITQLFITDAGALTLPQLGWRRVCLPLSVCSTRACLCSIRSVNCWHATPHSRRGKRQEEKRKRSCHKHGNQRDMKREVRIKEQKEKRQGISSLIFSLSQPRTFQSSTAQSTVTKKKRFFELPAKLKLSYRGAQPFQHKRLFFFFFFYPPRVLLLSSCTHEIKHNISAFY